MIRLHSVAVLVVVWLVVIPVAATQATYGNAAGITATAVLEISPTGAVSTIVALPAGHTALGICTSIDNRGMAVLTRTTTASTATYHVMELKTGVLRTIGLSTVAARLIPTTQAGIVPEQRGDYITGTESGIFRFAGVGGAVSTVHTASVTGLCDRLTRGGWLSFSGNAVFNQGRGGGRSKVVGMSGPIPLGIGSIATDTTTGNAYATSGALFFVDLGLKTFTTLARVGAFGSFQAVDIDPVTRDLVVGTSTGVYRVDRQGSVLATWATFTPGVIGLAVIGSGHTSGFGPVTPGTNYDVIVSYPAHPGFFYQVAASFGYNPGITTPFGTVPLNPDALFFLSVSVPQIFQKFSGQLNTQGLANPVVAIPNGPLQGVRIFLAGLVHDGKGAVQVISEPMGLSIE